MAVALTSAYLRQSVNFIQPNGSDLFPSNTIGTLDERRDFTSGVTANKVDTFSVQTYVILASQTLTIDLDGGTYSVSGGGASGSVIDANGAVVTYARVKFMWVELVIGTSRSNNAKVNGAASNVCVTDWTAGLHSDGTKNVAASYVNNTATGAAITASTADKVVVVNQDASVAYVTIAIGGGAS